jgi:hypothetical protein
MIQLYTALLHAHIPELEAKNVLTELENTIHSEVKREFLTMNLTTITPIIREQDGIRNEVRRLNDKIDTVEERLNTKIDAIEKRLTAKIDFVEAKMDTKFQFHDKLLYTIIGLLVALSGFVVTNSIFIYQKLK